MNRIKLGMCQKGLEITFWEVCRFRRSVKDQGHMSHQCTQRVGYLVSSRVVFWGVLVILGLFQWFEDDALTSLGISLVFSSVDVLAPNPECPLGAPQITLKSSDPESYS